MVVIDATMLMHFLQPGAASPKTASGELVLRAKDRVENLISELERLGEHLLVPTPALAEVLVQLDPTRVTQTIDDLSRLAVFSVESFDQRAAIELAAMLRDELKTGRKRRLTREETWAKLKFDRQIVAIAKVHRATTIYSDDRDIRALGARAKMRVVGLAELELPPTLAQTNLFERQ